MVNDNKSMIINSPYREPEFHWKYNNNSGHFDKINGRRISGYYVTDKKKNNRFIELALVNQIRPRVNQWRMNDYPGITNTTRTLIEHWHDDNSRNYPFFWCQLEAIETLIFLAEAPQNLKAGLNIENDGGSFSRICTKLCTGGGKTIVMSMLIAWQVCNKINYPKDKRFTKNILIITPNLTVKKRLQVLLNNSENNYYAQFNVVPPEFQDRLTQAEIIIHNWQALSFETEEDIKKRKTVDKRGVKSDNAYSREIVRNMKNILVINDEAHHAYRYKSQNKKLTKEEKESIREATIWISGLDKIDRARKIMMCYDFSATPYVPGKGSVDEEGLFGWIVSDFSLNDGIEAGIVKTPRFVVRDNAVPDENYRSKLSHIYYEVKDDLNNKSTENMTLPDLVRNAYMILGNDWLETFNRWRESGRNIPPVMITVANSTNTAARIENFFLGNNVIPEELKHEILRIDSSVLDEKSNSESSMLREIADSVGVEGKSGEKIRSVISVGMLSEGWDARNVTHIMGLRAFTSQLLCEQVIGRGLRRTSYDRPADDELFYPEYVNVFGIPFEFLPHEDVTGKPVPTPETTKIFVCKDREQYRITWPNITRVEHVLNQKLSLNYDDIPELILDAYDTRINAQLAPVIDNRIDLTKTSDMDLEKLYNKIRIQSVIFESAGMIYDKFDSEWQRKGTKLGLLAQVIKLIEEYLLNGRIKINPELFVTNKIRRKILMLLNMEKIISHIWRYIESECTEDIIPVVDMMKRERSTSEMLAWHTARNNELTIKSEINRCVFDSKWEASEAYNLDRNENVYCWAKNDHLGFYVNYLFDGKIRKYLPDFLIRLKNGVNLILEVKGLESEQDRIKREALKNWVRGASNLRIYGVWVCDVSFSPADVDGIIAKYIND